MASPSLRVALILAVTLLSTFEEHVHCQIVSVSPFCEKFAVPYGYDCAEYKTQTVDGYVLVAHRISHSSKETSQPRHQDRQGNASTAEATTFAPLCVSVASQAFQTLEDFAEGSDKNLSSTASTFDSKCLSAPPASPNKISAADEALGNPLSTVHVVRTVSFPADQQHSPVVSVPTKTREVSSHNGEHGSNDNALYSAASQIIGPAYAAPDAIPFHSYSGKEETLREDYDYNDLQSRNREWFDGDAYSTVNSPAANANQRPSAVFPSTSKPSARRLGDIYFHRTFGMSDSASPPAAKSRTSPSARPPTTAGETNADLWGTGSNAYDSAAFLRDQGSSTRFGKTFSALHSHKHKKLNNSRPEGSSRSLVGVSVADSSAVSNTDRLLDQIAEPLGSNQSPVLLMHPEFLNGDSWFQHAVDDTDQLLPFLLLNSGFDVWIGHQRATYWGHDHVNLTSDNPDYWNWTWDELARYDMPALINVVSEHTGATVHLVGLSQSATAGAAAATMPELSPLLRSLTLVGPTVYRGNASSLALNGWQVLMGDYSIDSMTYQSESFHNGPFNYSSEVPIDSISNTGRMAAALTAISGPNCCLGSTTVNFKNGWDGTTSIKNMLHFQQGIRSDKWRRFDYGTTLNVKAYQGMATPPDYHPQDIPSTLPLLIIYGGQDSTAPVQGSQTFLSRLRSSNSSSVFLPQYAHFDLLYSFNRTQDVFIPVLQFLEKLK